MPGIRDLIKRIKAEARAEKPTIRIKDKSTSTEDEILKWELKHGYTLPDDYQLFLKEIGECLLHLQPGGADHTCSVRLMPLKEVDRYSWVVASDKIEEIPQSWFAFADHHDNNWICFDLAAKKGERVLVYDGCWEICARPEEWEVLAHSFSEFLEKILNNRNTSPMGGNGLGFWQDPNHPEKTRPPE